MKPNKFITSLFASLMVITIGCNTIQTSTIATLIPSTPRIVIGTTPTEIQLPYNPNIGDTQYCDSANIVLPEKDTANFSEDQIAGRLVELWLNYFKTEKAPDYCRVEDYHVDKVYYDQRTPALSLEPKGDFIRVVQFSIKLIQVPNYWMSLAGEIDQNNWLHTERSVAVFKTEDGYVMKFANP